MSTLLSTLTTSCFVICKTPCKFPCARKLHKIKHFLYLITSPNGVLLHAVVIKKKDRKRNKRAVTQ